MTDDLSLANERQLVRALLDSIERRNATERDIESRHAEEVAGENRQYQAAFQALSDSYESEQANLEASYQSQLEEIGSRYQSESSVVRSEYQRVLTETENRYKTETEAATKEHDESVWLVSSLLDDDTEGSPLQRLQHEQSTYAAAEIELATGMQILESEFEKVVRFLKRSHMWSDVQDPEPTVELSTVDSMKSACLDSLAASEPLRRRILNRALPVLFAGITPFFLFLIVAGLAFSAIWSGVDPGLIGLKLSPNDRDWMYISAGIAAAISLLPMFVTHYLAGQKIWPDYEQLLQHRVNAAHAHEAWERTSKTELNMLEAECIRLHELRMQRRETAIQNADTKLQTRLTEAERLQTTALQQIRGTYPARLTALDTGLRTDNERINDEHQSASQDIQFRRESDFRMLQSEFDKRSVEQRRRYQQEWLELIRDWSMDVERLGNQSDSYLRLADSLCPSWIEILRNDHVFPAESPPILSIGRLEVRLDGIEEGVSSNPKLRTDRQQFDLPAIVPLRDNPSLIIEATGKGRDAAVQTLQTTMLRFLTSLPPGKVRFTILDPIGLGANFSAFMHLADFDELLVTSRIWTEPSHIEKRLADLTEHMETVLQTYLRNEFATIDEYNEFAGEVAEPYRVLVVANFPANFTDVALRRLASIAEGGRRCGVYLLMSFDKSLELPRGFAAADLKKHATVLEWKDKEFRSGDPILARWPLKLQPPPTPDEFGQIVRLAGQNSRDVRRVEVPFERVSPSNEDFWTSDSRSGVDVPIGRAGATKLQSLKLGKGTSQHVLIAGKTGSGKSTLLHALIANLSLHYSPAEIEFYLIDFKKGVEFKVYAERRLPHARVIAIESDREFGVSVLERLDAVLRERGELFREAGVQDIAGFRNARPDAVMPRTLLLVDEFQEFFIEDDGISQQAALLLDRLIRQGRAFGVHVLLGSQTLAGAYSLARSTLGQVAVRIALQCSETDAHLILSEENTAARLLTRPGEAIYNDANGLVEGNHPFQIVWLGEEEREQVLNQIRSEADGKGALGKTTPAIRERAAAPAVVFEGNIPADPTENPQLLQVLDHARSTLASVSSNSSGSTKSNWHCWLGDAVSLGGPIEMTFGLRDGGNVLIVGRDERSALGVMTSCVLALSARAVEVGAASAIRILDGSLPNSESSQTWRSIQSVWNNVASSPSTNPESPSVVSIGSPRDTQAVLKEIHAELTRRGDEPGTPMFLFVFDIARFRDLRKAEDDYSYSSGFGSSEEKELNPAQVFAEILRDGPSVGIFTLTWVDSLQTSQRWLSRDQMNRFEQRILFAMNANDSSTLIDSPQAGRLGENRALLYRGDLGTIEKFRPFSCPSAGWLKRWSSSETKSAPQPPNPEKSIVEQPTVPHENPAEETSSEPANSHEMELSDELPNIDDMHVV